MHHNGYSTSLPPPTWVMTSTLTSLPFPPTSPSSVSSGKRLSFFSLELPWMNVLMLSLPSSPSLATMTAALGEQLHRKHSSEFGENWKKGRRGRRRRRRGLDYVVVAVDGGGGGFRWRRGREEGEGVGQSGGGVARLTAMVAWRG